MLLQCCWYLAAVHSFSDTFITSQLVTITSVTSSPCIRLACPLVLIRVVLSKQCKKRGGKVVFSVVDSIGNVDVEQCRKIAEKLGIPLRVRVKE